MANSIPQVKNEEQYRALRNEGASKEKAARIANSDPHKTSVKGGKASPYEERTKKQLYQQAKELDISGRSNMNKQQLITALRNH